MIQIQITDLEYLQWIKLANNNIKNLQSIPTNQGEKRQVDQQAQHNENAIQNRRTTTSEDMKAGSPLKLPGSCKLK